jgi:predicted ArsR family transcriptional regulator
VTQDQLADTTGLTPVHVNRSLKALEVEGLIERVAFAPSKWHWQRNYLPCTGRRGGELRVRV